MPVKEEEATGADEEAEELQGTGRDRVVGGFLRQLFPPLLLGAIASHIPTAVPR